MTHWHRIPLEPETESLVAAHQSEVEDWVSGRDSAASRERVLLAQIEVNRVMVAVAKREAAR